MLIDTHCHIYPSEMENADEIIRKCSDISLILNGIDKKSNEEIILLSKKYDNVYAAIGFDNSVADNISLDDLYLLEQQIKENNVVAIGEIGLDYHYRKDNKEQQKLIFKNQIELAIKYDLPVIVHARDAVQDVYDILSQYNVRGSMHCFAGSIEMAQKFIDLGFYIGIDGPITFKNNKKQKELVRNIDINRILIETDSPYLTPEPKRGQQNDSSNLIYILKEISSTLNIDENTLEKILYINSNRLYNLK